MELNWVEGIRGPTRRCVNVFLSVLVEGRLGFAAERGANGAWLRLSWVDRAAAMRNVRRSKEGPPMEGLPFLLVCLFA